MVYSECILRDTNIKSFMNDGIKLKFKPCLGDLCPFYESYGPLLDGCCTKKTRETLENEVKAVRKAEFINCKRYLITDEEGNN